MPILSFSICARRLATLWQRRAALLLFACCFLCILSACGSAQAMGTGPTPTPASGTTPAPTFSTARLTASTSTVLVYFNVGTSYAEALRLVTSLGLHLVAPCMREVDQQGNVVAGTPWHPLGNSDAFNVPKSSSSSNGGPVDAVGRSYPALEVGTTVLSPADWQTRLHASSLVHYINTSPVYSCPHIAANTQGLLGISAQDIGKYVTVTFTSPVSYDEALATITNLGFRMADPKYEHESGNPADWHPMGQQASFASTHTLVLSPTTMAPSDWRTRIAHAQGVVKIAVS